MKHLIILLAFVGLGISAHAQEYRKITITEDNSTMVGSRFAKNSTIISDAPDTDNGYTLSDTEHQLNAEFSNKSPELYVDGAIPADQNFNNACVIPVIQDHEMSVQQNYCPQHVEGPRRYRRE